MKKLLLICSIFFFQVSCSGVSVVTLQKNVSPEYISNRYLSNKGANGALKLIYDYAVNSVKISNYSEALVLFGVLANVESSQAAAYNNKGVVYELMNDRLKALEMYSKANLLDDCGYFRENYFACLYAKP